MKAKENRKRNRSPTEGPKVGKKKETRSDGQHS